MRRFLAAVALGTALALAAVGPALADASPQASCLGQGASGVPPGTKDEVAHTITALAQATGTTHGQIVSGFAQQHSGCPLP